MQLCVELPGDWLQYCKGMGTIQERHMSAPDGQRLCRVGREILLWDPKRQWQLSEGLCGVDRIWNTGIGHGPQRIESDQRLHQGI